MNHSPPKQPNQGLIEGLRCLQAVALKGGNVRASDIAEELGLEPTRVHRLLKTLAHLGFTRQNSARRYAAGPGIYVLAAQTLQATSFFQEAVGPLEALRIQTPHITAMGALWNREVTYLYHGRGDAALRETLGAFGSWEASNSGVGWAVLSGFEEATVRELYQDEDLQHIQGSLDSFCRELRRARKRGYADLKVHGTEGHTTIARRLEFNPYLAIALSGKISQKEKPGLVKKLLETAQTIEQLHRKVATS